jgi:phage protein D
VQHGESDWDLLTRLCAAVGVDAWLEEPTEEQLALAPDQRPTLYLRSAGEPGRLVAPVVLRAGVNLLGFQIQVEAKTRRTTSNIVNLKGVPVLEGADDEAQARAVQLANTGVVLGASEDAPSFGEADIQRALLAGAKQRKVFEATATISPAEPGLTPARAVFAEGLGARYNGAWVVETIKDDLLTDRQTLSIYNDGAP